MSAGTDSESITQARGEAAAIGSGVIFVDCLILVFLAYTTEGGQPFFDSGIAHPTGVQ